MIPVRVIPCLLLKGRGLVKTVRFKDPTYIGDPINAVKIFNDKQADELIFLDITATPEGRGPAFALLEQLATECFMPLAYGGGVSTMDQMRTLFSLGIEKVCINTAAVRDPAFLGRAAEQFGSQSVVAAMDVKSKLLGGYEVRTAGGREAARISPVDLARRFSSAGAGEILVNSIDRDGMMTGYDLELVRSVAEAVTVPVIACGGAGSLADVNAALRDGKASAAAAGSIFVFKGRHRAVLISYPNREELRAAASAAAETRGVTAQQ